MKIRFSIAVLMTCLSLAAGASAQDRRDLRIADDVGRAITEYVRLTIFDDVNATIENGVVTLTGRVTMPFKKNDIERTVAKIDGIRELRSEIGVLPVSNFDDQLRYRIARAIYGNPTFWSYASMARPPIHIIVENGRVTLAGVVNSNVERVLARSLATGFGEFSVTNELKTDAETSRSE
jgi:hyperosmotically inducible protein